MSGCDALKASLDALKDYVSNSSKLDHLDDGITKIVISSYYFSTLTVAALGSKS